MRGIVFSFLLSWTTFSTAQTLEEMLKLNQEAELNIHSASIHIHSTSPALPADTEYSRYSFIHQGPESLHLIETGHEHTDAVYTIDNKTVHRIIRGLRRLPENKETDGVFISHYKAVAEMSDKVFLSRSFFDEEAYPLVYGFLLGSKELVRDSIQISWSSEDRSLNMVMLLPNGDRNHYCWKFNSSNLLIHKSFNYQHRSGTVLFGFSCQIRFSDINTLNYLEMMGRLKAYETCPMVYADKPDNITLSVKLKPGTLIPDFVLMDSKGQTRYWSDYSIPALIVYPLWGPGQDEERDALFRLIDSLEDAHPDWLIIISVKGNIDDLARVQRMYPNLRSAWLISPFPGMEMNGFPVWVLMDRERRVLAIEHGWNEKRKSTLIEWIRRGLETR